MRAALLLLLSVPTAAFNYLQRPGGINGFGWLMGPPVHRDAELHPIVSEGKWGFIDSKGRLTVEARFDAVRPCVGGAAAVRVGSKWGVIGRNGKMLVSPLFDDAGVISDGMLAVRKGELWSFLSTGQMAQAAVGDGELPRMSFDFEPIGDFHEGFAAVYVKRGPSGEKISQLAFIAKSLAAWAPDRMQPVTEFSDGAAAVRIYEQGAMRPGAVLIGPDGGTLAEMPDAVMLKNFSGGMAPATRAGGWGYIDKAGRWAVPPRYTNAEPFFERRARIQISGDWGFIDAKGTVVIPARYSRAGDFSDGLAAVCLRDGDQQHCGYLDPAGKTAIALRYRMAYGFSSGAALVLTDGMQYKYIGKDGRDIWAPAFEPMDVMRLNAQHP